MKPVGFSMKQGAAGSMHTGRASAACFHWGAFMKKNRAAAAAEREKRRNLMIMKLFYLLPYDGEKDFYEQFEKRMQMAERSLR